MLAEEEVIDENRPAQEIMDLEGMDEQVAFALAERGIRTLDDLADLATDEITDIEGVDEQRAAQLIMAARAPMIARLEQGG
jgi:N utilization substance protein A